ncbi:MAG: diphosphomevalonate decarboxylase [Anaerolineae bacterium]|nr:diphosphomevalonate decarboxylase [Anaerolineae bacterium]
MQNRIATALGFANIAFVKYWGVRDAALNLALNDSISMNLSDATTVTTVEFGPLAEDTLAIDDQPANAAQTARVSRHLDHLRALAGVSLRARVVSRNSFPMGTGLASSAAGFAALTVAGAAALGLDLAERELSAVARLGSGSACRSVPGGFTRWHAGRDHASSYAETIAPPDYWDLRDVLAVVSTEHKAVGSAEGHTLAQTSPFLGARLADLPRRLARVQDALLARDLPMLGEELEAEAIALHVLAMTSRPSILYWEPATLEIMRLCPVWRAAGLLAYFTLDAGPNVHLICEAATVPGLLERLQALPSVQRVIVNGPAGPTHLLP